MYILALLFGIVNFYFLLSALIIILGLFTEYVQVPLINWGAKLLHMQINYNLERTFSHGTNSSNESNGNMFNTIFNQNKLESDKEDLSAESDELDEQDETDEPDETNTNETIANEEESDEQDNQKENPNHFLESDEKTHNLTPSPIIIDETLD